MDNNILNIIVLVNLLTYTIFIFGGQGIIYCIFSSKFIVFSEYYKIFAKENYVNIYIYFNKNDIILIKWGVIWIKKQIFIKY